MKVFRRLGLAAAMALVVVACVGAMSASATTICTSGTTTAPCGTGLKPGGAITAISTNSALTLPGFPAISCTTSTISGTAPSTTATTVSAPVTLRYGADTVPAGSCTAFGLAATVKPEAACDPGGAAPLTLSAKDEAGVITTQFTIPAACTVTIGIAATGCKLSVSGEQTINAAWTNGTTSVFSSATVDQTLASTSNGTGLGCPPAGHVTGTLEGTYRVTSPTPAPGVIIQP